MNDYDQPSDGDVAAKLDLSRMGSALSAIYCPLGGIDLYFACDWTTVTPIGVD